MDSVIAITKARRAEFPQAESLLLNTAEKLGAMPLFKNSVERLFVLQRVIAFYEYRDSVEPNQGHLERAKPFREQAATLEQAVTKRRAELAAMVAAYRASRGGSLIPAEAAPDSVGR
jgi:hypothetical protein